MSKDAASSLRDRLNATPRAGLLIACAAAFVLIALFAGGWWIVYAKPASELRAQLRAETSAVEDRQRIVSALPRVRAELASFGKTTLGRDPDGAIHRFRTHLGELAREAELADIVVTTNAPRGAENPAARERVGTGMRRVLRDRPDFWVIQGQLTGKGSLEACLRTLAGIAAQPWAHRVDRFTIRPEGRERAVYVLTVQVASAFMPDLGEDGGAPGVRLAELDSSRWSMIASPNPFLPPPPEPAPEPVRVAEPPPAPPPPAPPPYDRWRVVGIVETGSLAGDATGNGGGKARAEVWMEHTGTGRTRVLGAGDEVLGLRLVSASGEVAVFESGGAMVEVRAGQTLAERRAPGRVDSR